MSSPHPRRVAVAHGGSWAAYATGVCLGILAVAATAHSPLLQTRPYLVPLGATVLTAWIGGFGPALACTGVGAVGGLVIQWSIGEPWGPMAALQAALFLSLGGVIASFARAKARTERAAWRQGAQLEAMFRQAAVGIALVGPDGRLRRVNRRFAEIVGRSMVDAEALRYGDLVHGDDWLAVAPLLNETAAGVRSECAFEQRYLRTDGSVVWAHVTMAQLVDPEDEAEGLVAVVQDITERRASAERVRVSEMRYRSLVEASAAIVWTASPAGELVPPQEPWEASTGQRPEEYAGWGWRQAVHPDDRSAVESAWRDALASGEVVGIEARIWSAAASAYRWYSTRAVPRRGPTGAVEEWVGACTDIHARRTAQLQLYGSEERARLALEIARVGAWSWELESGLLVADDRCREICDFPHGPLTVADLEARVHPDDWPRIHAALTTSAGPRYADECRVVHRNGAVHWVILRGQRPAPPEMVARRDVRLFGSMLDVTDRRLSEESLRDADRQKNDFLALLAHELRNPLAPIRTAVQLLKGSLPSEAERQRMYGVIERQVSHLVRLVEDLLDVSRVLRGRVELRPEPTDLASVIAASVEAARPLVDLQRQELTVTVPPVPVLVHGDHVRLAQVVSNLLNNASKYTPAGGTIRLAIEATAEDAVIRVSDSGAGIPPEVLPRIFEPFVQADRSLERAQGGLGIGLSLVRRIVELHGGTVEAASRGEGLGSEFVVHLPRLEVSERTVRPGNPAPSVVPRLHVLVVDDNVDAAESLALLLRARGQIVHVAHDGLTAMDEVARLQPDVVVLDIGLPGMTGYDVAAALRRRDDGPKPVLVAVTGYGQPADAARATAAGFDHHLVKPIDIASLEAVLSTCVPASRKPDARAG